MQWFSFFSYWLPAVHGDDIILPPAIVVFPRARYNYYIILTDYSSWVQKHILFCMLYYLWTSDSRSLTLFLMGGWGRKRAAPHRKKTANQLVLHTTLNSQNSVALTLTLTLTLMKCLVPFKQNLWFLFLYPWTIICQYCLIIVSSPRKNDDSRRHDDVISMHSR